MEQSRKIAVVPVSPPATEQETQEADRRSKLTTSTDEWGLNRACLHRIFQDFGFRPTVDAFASSDNISEKYFSKWPQGDGSIDLRVDRSTKLLLLSQYIY
jgi:hypothetical protein